MTQIQAQMDIITKALQNLTQAKSAAEIAYIARITRARVARA